MASATTTHGVTLASFEIVSGGQTGVDRGALDAALAHGMPCGGWCPAGRRAEDGAIPNRYPLTALDTSDYRYRTHANVRDTTATLILCPGTPTGGTALTVTYARQLQRPCLIINAENEPPKAGAARTASFVSRHGVDRLNVAGPRASSWPRGVDYARLCLEALIARLLEPIRETTS